jgi:hypothetical protein
MGHSKAYNDFKEWIGLIGTKEGDYFLPDRFLDELQDMERDEVERIVYEKFKDGSTATGYFARYMPKLTNYDGVGAMREYVGKQEYISGILVDVAAALYDATREAEYIGVIMDVYRQTHKSSYVSILSDCEPSEDLFKALAEIYVNDSNDTNQFAASTGLLHGKGYIKNPSTNYWDNEKTMDILRLLRKEDVMQRAILTEKLWSEQPLIDGCPVPESLF